MNLTKNELAAAVGVSVQTVNGWMRNGLPNTKRKGKGTRKVVVFDVVAAVEWFASNNRAKYVYRLDKHLPKPPPRADKTAPDQDGKPIPELTVLDMMDRMMTDAYAAYQQAKDDGLQGMQHEAMRTYIDVANARRQVRNDHAKSEQSLAASMPVSEHERITYEWTAIVAQALKGAPRKIVGQLSTLTSKQKLQVLKIATTVINDTKRALANGTEDKL